MAEQPPRLPARVLAWALGSGESARSARGDLNEDFVRVLRTRGRRVAHRWFWREALSLSATALVRRILGRPFLPDPTRGDPTVRSSSGPLGILQDARYALRAVRRDPGFFAFATLIIGLGVGASTAVFSVMSPLMLKPLPFEDPDALVWIENTPDGGSLSALTSRTSNLRDFRERARSFDGLAGYNAFFTQRSYNLVGVGEPERLAAVDVTHDFLDVLGVRPALGRSFTYEEGLYGGPRAVILTYGYWMRRFAGDPSVVGTTLSLNDEPHAVVGVLPRSFDFSSVFTPATPVDFLIPWPVSDETDRQGNTTTIVGRLRPGVSIEAAQAELDAILQALQEAEPNRWGLSAGIAGLQERMSRSFRSGMLLLAAAAGLVMLIVCVNLSNMLLARSPRRRREMAVRRTLGATRPRLVRQLLIESVVVALSGALVGVALAVGATRYVGGNTALEIPMLSAVSVDRWALLFTVGVALLAGLAVGIVPALQIAEGGEAEALSGSSRGASVGRGAKRFREILVVGEVAMACTLLVFGGLVMKSFQRVMDVDLGFDTENVISWQLASAKDFDDLTAINAYYDEVRAAVEAVPGVRSVGLIDALPLGTDRTWCNGIIGFEQEGQPNACFFPHVVGESYLTTMGIPVMEGRGFERSDGADSAPVALVNRAAAEGMFPDGRALGHALRMWYGEAEVVGIVEDVRHRALESGSGFEVYFPMRQAWAFGTLDLVVRTSVPPLSLTGAVGAAVQSVDAALPTEDFRTLDAVVEQAVSPRRFTLQLLSAFALCALLLAGLGIYGVLSYSVTERIPEIGIRMALGASAAEVRKGVVGKTLVLAGIGVAIGSVVALAGSRLIGSLLYGVEPTDPATFGGMILVLLAVAVISGLIPAMRASRIDSAQALRAS